MSTILDKCLSMLLGWIRLPVKGFWQLFTSGTRNTDALYHALPLMLLVICAAGFLIDVLVKFGAWRSARTEAARNRETVPDEQPAYEEQAQMDAPAAGYAYEAYRRPGESMQAAYDGSTRKYDYAAQVSNSLDIREPVFDETPVRWDADWHDPYRRPAENWQEPQQAYTAVPAEPAAPVHPGLDDDSLRSNLNMPGSGEQPQQQEWRPFADVTYTPAPTGFGRLARRARRLVSLEGDQTSAGLRDYQPSVDVSQSFYAPVYPKQHPQDGDY